MKIYNYILIIYLAIISACSDKEDITPTPETLSGAELLFDEFNGQQLMIYKNETLGIMVAFEWDGVNTYAVNQSFPDIIVNSEGETWNIFGEPTRGNPGEPLEKIEGQIMGYWFSLASFFPKVTLEGDQIEQEKVIQSPDDPDWLVQTDHIAWAAIKESIPSIDNPSYFEFSGIKDLEIGFNNNDLFAVLKVNGEIYAFPYNILDWHEIVNTEIAGLPITLTYCPLTGTTTVYERIINGELRSFGVSGLLYNNNLIIYDRQTENLWSQILGNSINGDEIGQALTEIPFVEMNWRAINKFNNIQMLSIETGFSRDYTKYPYGDYRTNHSRISYSLSYDDGRVPAKEKVLGVKVDDKMKGYRY